VSITGSRSKSRHVVDVAPKKSPRRGKGFQKARNLMARGDFSKSRHGATKKWKVPTSPPCTRCESHYVGLAPSGRPPGDDVATFTCGTWIGHDVVTFFRPRNRESRHRATVVHVVTFGFCRHVSTNPGAPRKGTPSPHLRRRADFLAIRGDVATSAEGAGNEKSPRRGKRAPGFGGKAHT